MMSGNVKPKVRECGQHYNKPIIGLCLEEILILLSVFPLLERRPLSAYRLILRGEFRITSDLGGCLIDVHSFSQVTTNPFLLSKTGSNVLSLRVVLPWLEFQTLLPLTTIFYGSKFKQEYSPLYHLET